MLEHNVISDQQFGFRPGSSTQEAILSAAHSWHTTIKEGGSNVVVFLDLAKAFDTIQHDRVLSTLTSAGESGPLLTGFTSYLSGRQQFVIVQGASSTPTAVTSGVPQGSILVPLLFLLAFDEFSVFSFQPSPLLLGMQTTAPTPRLSTLMCTWRTSTPTSSRSPHGSRVSNCA